MNEQVYIVKVVKEIGDLWKTEEAVEQIYQKSTVNEKTFQIAKKSAKAVGIKYRPTVLDKNKFPSIALADIKYKPVNWCVKMVEELCVNFNKNSIGFISVGYNVSSEKNFLPSVSAKTAEICGLNLDIPPEDLVYYGCAAGVFSLNNAINYCKNNNKAALACSFDQCTWLIDPITDINNPAFNNDLKTNLIFSDGAAAVLVIPESMKNLFKDQPLMKVIDTSLDFKAGALIRMEDDRLILDDEIKNIMPPIVSERLIKPMLKNNNSKISEIAEWSLHQGGPAILKEFCKPEILGLNEIQVRRAKELLLEYGNFSGPSSLIILESFFNEGVVNEKIRGTKGMIASFGAGYYTGACLYIWE